MTVPPGELVMLQELAQDPVAFQNRSVRATGILTSYNPDSNRAVLEHKGYTLDVATDLLDPFPYKIKDLLQCIGELELSPESNQLLLHARVSRKVDSLDLDIYEKTIQLRRKYQDSFLNNTSS
ncbi:telomere-capping, CST complex subunit-domain-containing protein [Umbelopsis sp. PMI_123]|nr:telomere-capping, CST complex subunit-domain-containing protein [Umbelopsis sp. PMI_123]